MGTSNIVDILDNKEKLKDIKKIILQSNNNYYLLRKSIINFGFYITDETIIYENKKYYLTICFERGVKEYKEKDYYWGIIKPENLSYYEFLQTKYTSIYKKIPLSQMSAKMKMFFLLRELNKIIGYCKNFL